MQSFSKASVRDRLKAIHAIRDQEWRELPDGSEARWRAWGAMMAHSWLSAGFELGACEPMVFGRFVGVDGEPERFSKAALLARIDRHVTTLTKFDRNNGYAQAEGRGPHINRQYGFWSEIRYIATELDC